MSTTTMALIRGLENMLKDRGSMTVEEVKLLEGVIQYLREHDDLEGEKKMANGLLVTQLLMRFFLDPEFSKTFAHLCSHLIDKLL